MHAPPHPYAHETCGSPGGRYWPDHAGILKLDAFDGSSEMVWRASKLTGSAVRQLLLEDMADTPPAEKYDGIWCCASLLHVERGGLPSVMGALRRTLIRAGSCTCPSSMARRIGSRTAGISRAWMKINWSGSWRRSVAANWTIAG